MTFQHSWLLKKTLLILMLCSVNPTFCYKAGANPTVCNLKEMKPEHTLKVGFIEDESFTIELSTDVYDPSDSLTTINVRILSPTSTLFKGFLIQARKVDSFDYIAKGVLEGPPTLSAQVCGRSGNALTHNSAFSNNWRQEISMSWRPPPDVCEAMAMGDLHFQATVVKQFVQPPHINIFSQVLYMSNNTEEQMEACAKQRSNNGCNVTRLNAVIIAIVLILFAMCA